MDHKHKYKMQTYMLHEINTGEIQEPQPRGKNSCYIVLR